MHFILLISCKIFLPCQLEVNYPTEVRENVRHSSKCLIQLAGNVHPWQMHFCVKTDWTWLGSLCFHEQLYPYS